MNTLNIVFIAMCLGIIVSLIAYLFIKIEANLYKIETDVIEKKIDKNKDYNDIRIAIINRIIDSIIAVQEQHREATKQNTDKINILMGRVNKINRG